MRTVIFIAIFLLVAAGFTSESFAANPQIEQHDADIKADLVVLDTKPDQMLSSSSPTLPMGVGMVQAGATVTIYRHFLGNVSREVTVTVSDYSPGTDSVLSGRYRSSLPPNVVTVPDNNTTTATFQLTGSGDIVLECLGTGGYCIYKIDSLPRS